MGLSRYEKETVILFNSLENFVHFSTSQDFMKRRIKKLAEEYPDEVKIISEDKYTVIAEFPKKFVKLAHPRVLTEEQRQAAAERLKKFRNGQKTEEIEDDELIDIDGADEDDPDAEFDDGEV